MKLSEHGREFYTATITSSPAVTGAWEATFDDGTTWHEGEEHPTLADTWRWLLAGASADPTGAVAVINRSLQPTLRAVDSPEIVARRADTPTVNYNAA